MIDSKVLEGGESKDGVNDIGEFISAEDREILVKVAGVRGIKMLDL